ncbi:hypothetical protein G6F62_011116 [Rhizopus arrhizus]|nr:hypothetical protein G6F62_011116 [Rhizopus arrhizus]
MKSGLWQRRSISLSYQNSQFTVDTTQVVNAHYKGAENSRLHGRAATEIFELLLTIKSGELTVDEANQLLDEALESARRLAIHAWAQGKQHDEDAKDYATRALRLPPSLKHLEAKESGSKREAFSEEFIVKYNEANYQQRVLRAAITSSPGGRGRGGHQSTSTWNSNRGGCGFYGRGGTKNYFGGRGLQHQQTIQHRERPTSNTTNITIFSKTSSIITSSFTTNTINPYYNFNNQLHHSLRWHSTGQSPTTFPPLLENNNQSSLAFIRDSKWLQNPIYQKTDPMEESEENDDSRRSTSYQRSSTKIPGWRDDRGFSNTKPSIPLQILYSTGNDKEKTDPGLPKIEFVHPSRTLQDGGSSSTKRTYGKRRLHLQNRFKGRIRSCPNTRRLLRFFKLRERRNCLPIQIPSVWPQCSTKSFLQNHALCYRTSKKRRNSHHLLFGRYMHPGKDETRDGPGNEQKVSGLCVQQQNNDDICIIFEDYQPNEEDSTVAYFSKENVQMDSRSTREDDFHDSSSRRSSITHKIPTTGPVENIAPDSPELESNLQIVKYQSSGVTLQRTQRRSFT